MEPIDLEKYKELWKKESIFEEQKLSEDEISVFIQSSSENLKSQFKGVLIFDLVIKFLLVVASLLLPIVYSGSSFSVSLSLLILFLLAGILIQFRVLGKINFAIPNGQKLVETLRAYLDFYYRYYVGSLVVGATSSTLFFLIGSLYYLINKYQKIPAFQWDDYLVFGIGIVLSFGLSFFTQLKFNQYKINQLEECLNDAGEVEVDKNQLQTIKSDKKKYQVILGLAVILGLILLLFLIFA